jgi:hypothetical protein
MDCKDPFISEVADTAAHTIARRVMTTLQRRKAARPSGDDAGWANHWDEGCGHVHGEASVVWERDAERIKQRITEEVRTHPAWVKQALWLQTDAGFAWCWDIDHGEASRLPRCTDEERDAAIADYILREYIVEQAEAWSNPRIREYLARQYQGHFP